MANGDLRIEIADRTGAKVLDITKFKGAVSFDFVKTGGCNSAQFTLPWDFEDHSSLGALYEVTIYVEGATPTPFWSGYIHPDFNPKMDGQDDIQVSCVGWKAALHDRLVPDTSYTSTSLKIIMLDLMTNYAHTRIIVDAANVAQGT